MQPSAPFIALRLTDVRRIVTALRREAGHRTLTGRPYAETAAWVAHLTEPGGPTALPLLYDELGRIRIALMAAANDRTQDPEVRNDWHDLAERVHRHILRARGVALVPCAATVETVREGDPAWQGREAGPYTRKPSNDPAAGFCARSVRESLDGVELPTWPEVPDVRPFEVADPERVYEGLDELVAAVWGRA